jgi:hypothetical protein
MSSSILVAPIKEQTEFPFCCFPLALHIMLEAAQAIISKRVIANKSAEAAASNNESRTERFSLVCGTDK